MGMYDTVTNVEVECPICGDTTPKDVQIKTAEKLLWCYGFNANKIPVNWEYKYDENLSRQDNTIGGIAICIKCHKRILNERRELLEKYKSEGRVQFIDGAKSLYEATIDGENAVTVINRELDNMHHGNYYTEYLFHVRLYLDDNNIAIRAESIFE